MFGWFNKKPEPIEPERQKAVANDPVVINDWRPEHGSWFEATVCHCGAEYTHSKVCSRCGHKDKWETFVARWEWEHSETMRRDWIKWGAQGLYSGKPHKMPYTRNAKLIRWTEEHCHVKYEAKPAPKRTATKKGEKP